MPIQFSTEDLQSTDRLERVLRQFQEAIDRPAPTPPRLPSLNALAMSLAPLLSKQLGAGGIAPLNLQSLLPALTTGATILEDTHANRLTLYSGGSIPGVGSVFFETDRMVLYVVVLITGVLTWRYAGGVNVGTSGSFPGDLGVNDAGFLFLASDTITQYTWSGTQWDSTGGLYQTITNSVSTVQTLLIIQHLDTIGASNGIGASYNVQLSNSTPATQDASSVQTTFTNATAASETSDWSVFLRNAGAALAKKFRILGDATVEFIGKIVKYNNAAPTDGQLLIGNTGGARFDAATLTGTVSQITVTNAAGSITLSFPTDIIVGSWTTSSATPITGAGGVALGNTTAATATNGGGQATPANVDGYLVINVAGTNKKVPYYPS